MPVPVELLRFFDKMTPTGPTAERAPSLADFGDTEVAEAEAAIGGHLPAAEPPEAIPPVKTVAIPPVEAPEINGSEVPAEVEQAGRP
jgi:hypothetical protein